MPNLLRANVWTLRRASSKAGDRLNGRLAKLAGEEHLDGDTRRLTNRLRKYAEFIFTFLDYRDVPFENNCHGALKAGQRGALENRPF